MNSTLQPRLATVFPWLPSVAAIRRFAQFPEERKAAERAARGPRRRLIPPADWRFPGEISSKEFLAREAKRTGLGTDAIRVRIHRGKYPGLKLKRLNHYDTICWCLPGI